LEEELSSVHHNEDTPPPLGEREGCSQVGKREGCMGGRGAQYYASSLWERESLGQSRSGTIARGEWSEERRETRVSRVSDFIYILVMVVG
jgi:hypothetical protein